MKLGYIHSSEKERANALAVLKMAAESNAIDELGIGRIRDAFSNMMFPGTSSLQKHIKYLALMSLVIKKAAEEDLVDVAAARREMRRVEIEMTKALKKNSPNAIGITGADIVNAGGGRYVVYDPAYINFASLRKFEILKTDASIPQVILKLSKERPLEQIKGTDDETADDDKAVPHVSNLFDCPKVEYDFPKDCSIDVTPREAKFITEHILNAEGTQGSLLHFLVEKVVNQEEFVLPQELDALGLDLNPELSTVYDRACKFADFIYIVHVRYNYLYSKGQDGDMENEFDELSEKFRASGVSIEDVLKDVEVTEQSCKMFCIKAASHIMNGDTKELDKLIVSRERRVKGNRSKINNPNFVYDKSARVHHYKLDFRWPTVRVFIEELQKAIKQ